MTPEAIKSSRLRRRKKSTTLYLEADQHERLKALSIRTRVPVAEYIREAVDLVLEGRTSLRRRNERLGRLAKELEDA